jgi:hypothetical protein
MYKQKQDFHCYSFHKKNFSGANKTRIGWERHKTCMRDMKNAFNNLIKITEWKTQCGRSVCDHKNIMMLGNHHVWGCEVDLTGLS